MGIFEIFWNETVNAFKGLITMWEGGFEGVINGVVGFIWQPLLVIICLGAGLYFSIKMKFPQVRKIKRMVTLLFKKRATIDERGVSSFSAFAIAVSGRVGTGNIVGVATAIAFGGPGALFWMWLLAFLGAGSAFVESTLAQLYKEEIKGQYRGGPAFYFQKVGFKVLAVIFMIACIISSAVLLPGPHSNAIVVAFDNNFGISPVVTAIVIFVLLGLVIVGGIKSIAKAADLIVPVMSVMYIAVVLIILITNATSIPAAFGAIFKSAFGFHEALAGSLGWAILWGIKRGAYSNEAGLGTAAHAAAAADVSHPAKQGLVQAFSVYFDTFLVCTATGLAILCTGIFTVFDQTKEKIADGVYNVYTNISTSQLSGTELEQVLGDAVGSSGNPPKFTPEAFNTLINGFGGKFIAIAIFFFAFTTLMAYYYYAETNLDMLMKKYSGKARDMSIWALKLLYLGCTVLFALKPIGVAFGAADIGMGAMAWINIIGILFIAKPAFIALKDYERRERLGTDDELFTVESLPESEQAFFKHVTFWRKAGASKTTDAGVSDTTA